MMKNDRPRRLPDLPQAHVCVTRGCCERCYGRHRRAVARGKKTWAELEAAGLTLPVQPPGKGWRKWSLGAGER